jgi:hypothetical protein
MDTGKFQLIRESDFVLSRCGRFTPPQGSIVYIPKSFLLQAVLPITTGQTFYKSITGDTTWCWRSIQFALSGVPPLVSAQVMNPHGKFLYNGLLNLTQVAGYGSNRFALSREIECPPGSKIQLTLDDTYLAAAAVQPVSMLCGGAYAYYLKDGIRSVCAEDSASDMKRIFSGVNQNLLAPCWMGGDGPAVPAGISAGAMTYGDGFTNILTMTIGAAVSGTASIQIDNDYDFHVRRFLFDVIKGESVTAGSFLARIRSGSGYAFCDDYVNVAKYIGSAYMLKGWDIRRGDQIEFDFLLVDGAGTGTISIQCFADGERRRAA